jgi:hypothetical protein
MDFIAGIAYTYAKNISLRHIKKRKTTPKNLMLFTFIST